MHDIFLSYSTKDRQRLEPLVSALEKQGWTVFWDHRAVKVSQEWHAVIDKAIHECPCVIVAWSNDSIQSQWVKEEALIARDRGVSSPVLYPVMLDNVQRPFGFNMIQSVDFTDWNGKVNHPKFLELREQLALGLDLRKAAGRQSAPPPDLPTPKPQPIYTSPTGSGGGAGTSFGGGLKALGLSVAVVVALGGGWSFLRSLPDVPITQPEPPVIPSPKPEPTPIVPPQPEPPKTYHLTVKATPPDAKVTVDGKAYDAGQLWEAGTYEVQASAKGFKAQAGKVTLKDADVVATLVLEADRLPSEPEMVAIPGGSFVMGCDSTRDDVEGGCSDDEKPSHTVKISPFLLAKTEVTNAQYMACVEAKGCPAPEDYGKDFSGANYPVVGVSWDNATAYVKWLSKTTGKTYRLPTEAEWEYAARAGTDTAYPWGTKASHEYANYGKDSCCDGLANGKDKWVYTSPVGSFSANAFGLYDMHGNVWEWTGDWYGDYVAESVSDPKGPDSGSARVLRGGSWLINPQYLRSALRRYLTPDSRYNYLGFRPAQVQ